MGLDETKRDLQRISYIALWEDLLIGQLRRNSNETRT